MNEYESNSFKAREKKAKEDNRKVEKVVTGLVKTKKKNHITKFGDIFLPEDVEEVKSHVIEDVIVPAIKDIILDAVRAFLGINDRGSQRSSADRVSFRDYSSRDSRKRISDSTRVSGIFDFDDIILDNRGEAEEVLDRLDELVSTYGEASVADLYDLVGMSCHYTGNQYGWRNLRNARVISTHNGYLLKMPKAIPLNN